ncbi:cation:proton antiporter [Novosphingobium profundi]|uniref:cation:proton antiporter n=1 Tax=Novosphingobium profundi TaxID=1774954 RepID=UPI001BDAAE9A|nr:cation:proton antiporter [Novosphingobium profundi]MBT0667629.1 cation:proton antiporter [Novosphingobium profundi]
MNTDILLLGCGLLVMLVAWLPLALRRLPLSLPMTCLGLGVAAGASGAFPLHYGALFTSDIFTSCAEVALVIALLGAGLKIDRMLGWKRWNTAWRLIGIGMPLMALLTAEAFVFAEGAAMPFAILLAGILSPTDPVLASSVSVGPPGSGGEGEVRFGLTAEAGLNDGLAFPIVLLGLALMGNEPVGAGWLAQHFILQVAVSLAIGWLVGHATGWFAFRLKHLPLSGAASGLVAIGVAVTAFSLTELGGGFGFIAVFVTPLALRATCPSDPFHRAMTDFTEQIERLVAMAVIFLFGMAVPNGLLASVSWREIAIAASLLLVARPAAVILAMIGSPLPAKGRLAAAFLGIRGIATLYYLAMTSAILLPDYRSAHVLAALTVLMSIVLFGLISGPMMRRIDLARSRAIEESRFPELMALPGPTQRGAG